VPQVLTTNAIILCPHGGKGISTPTARKWSVDGGVVLSENDPGVLACPFLAYPCSGYQLRSMGLNATRIDGRKVILVSDFNQTQTGLPLTMTETHRMIDNSTPAPVPPGQPPPPLSPELIDETKPVVTCVPPVLPFNSLTMLPATLNVTFTLFAAHPLKWILTLINEPLKTNVDVTDGLPPGLTVDPPGGVWETPSLVVTLTMTAVYMASLTRGTHRFFMTGVSKRGLCGFFEMILTVS